LRKIEEINSIACERRVLETTSRAILIIFKRFFCVEKIYEESDGKKEKKE
jgi:hypothetical protein